MLRKKGIEMRNRDYLQAVLEKIHDDLFKWLVNKERGQNSCQRTLQTTNE